MKPKHNRAAVKIMLCRMACVGVAVILFYSVGWLPLQAVLRDGVAFVMQRAGFPVTFAVYEGSPALLIGYKQFYFTSDCTYVSLWLLLIPFLWRLDRTWQRNLCWVLSFGLMVSVVNFIRVCMSTYLYTTGWSWLVAHELPDYLLYYPTLLVVALIALRRDLTLCATGSDSRGASGEAQRIPC